MNEARIVIIIEFDEFIAARELTQIIAIVDDAVWAEIATPTISQILAPQDLGSAFCIRGINKGSMEIVGILGGIAVKYFYDRFKRGLGGSRLGDEAEKLAKAVGDKMGAILATMRRKLEDYSRDAKANGSRIKNIRLEKSDRKTQAEEASDFEKKPSRKRRSNRT